MDKNIFGEPLIECSMDPLTGFFRDGCCKNSEKDIGQHNLCAVVDERFLTFSKSEDEGLTKLAEDMLLSELKTDLGKINFNQDKTTRILIKKKKIDFLIYFNVELFYTLSASPFLGREAHTTIAHKPSA